jgi:hypothetical protein
VPSTGDAMVFRDGGDTGEAVVRRVFAGMPYHLREGGTGIVVSLGRDGSDAKHEQRVRRWLAEAGRDCDVILGVSRVLSIDDMVGSVSRLHLGGDSEMAGRMAERFRELGTEKFVYGAAFIRRTGVDIYEPPLRLQMSAAATAADFERIFAWRRWRRSPEFAAWLAAARPRPFPQLESNIRYAVRNGALVPISALLTAKQPLAAAVQPDAWVAPLLERLDGANSIAQAFAVARAGAIPAELTLAAFVDLVDRLIERGLFDIDIPG